MHDSAETQRLSAGRQTSDYQKFTRLIFARLDSQCQNSQRAVVVGAFSRNQVGDMDIIKVPHLATLRAEIGELKQMVDGEPNEQIITQAWIVFDKIESGLKNLAPNHPLIWAHR
jgi:hypothetical protein